MVKLGEAPFKSIQGEGLRTGSLSVWVRFAGCNLRCQGFFQNEPTKPSTWIEPISHYKLLDYKSSMEMPVIEYGCDSLYSVDPKFKKFWFSYTEDELFNEIQRLAYDGSWTHPVTGNSVDLCFTGGEPLLQQKAIMNMLSRWSHLSVEDAVEGGAPEIIQIETNGTKVLSSELVEVVTRGLHGGRSGKWEPEFCFNVSPKLFNVSGEEYVWEPEIIASYFELAGGCLKFVVNNKDETWQELDQKVKELREMMQIMPPIYIMPVGATKEQQEDSKVIAAIANRAIENGYHISGRIHCNIWGNTIGV